MIGRWTRRILVLGTLGGLAYGLIRLLRGEQAPAFEASSRHPSVPPPARPTPTPAPSPAPIVEPAPEPVVEPVAEPAAAADGDWVEAIVGEDGPTTHPVKAKLKSGIYHLPGMLNYDRTVADRWYTTAEAAEADGLRRAKR